MSTEFIIGTIIGIIGIVPVIIQFVRWIKKKHNLRDLMTKLVDNSLSTKAHRKVLKQMNVMLLPIGKHISTEYINSFVLGKRGKEAVFTDLCLKNDWEPTKELCLMFMNGDYPSIRNKYWEMKREHVYLDVPVTETVVNGEVANAKAKSNEIVYLSELLEERFPESFSRLASSLRITSLLFWGILLAIS